MKLIRNLLLAASVGLAGLGATASASAATLVVNKVGVSSWAYNAGGHVSTAITFNDNAFVVFCVDLQHNIGVGTQDPALLFEVRTFDTAGNGAPVSQITSNKIGRLARLGRSIFFGPNDGFDTRNKNLAAIQGAIWQLEYGGTFNSTDSYVNAKIQDYAGIGYYGGGYAKAFYSVGNTRDPNARYQNQVGVVPEPATWALMIGGFGMAGAMIRRRRAIAA